MSLIYNTKQETWIYQKEKFTENKYVLRVIYKNTIKEACISDMYLFVPRLWSTDIIDIALKYKDKYPYIIFEDALFLHSNFQVKSNRKYAKYPNGNTCKSALKQLKLQKKSSFLVVNDDGSRILLPSIYFALKELGLIWLQKDNSKLSYSTLYCQNYISTSNSQEFTRARHKLDYYSYFDTFDYIIMPAFNGICKDDLIKLEKESKKGYIIYGNNTRLEGLPYNNRVKINKASFLFNIKGVKTKSTCEIKPCKTLNKQLIDHLRKDFK